MYWGDDVAGDDVVGCRCCGGVNRVKKAGLFMTTLC